MAAKKYSLVEARELWRQEPDDNVIFKAATEDIEEYSPEIQAVIKEEAERRRRLNMEHEKCEPKLTSWYVVFLIILTPVIYVASFLVLMAWVLWHDSDPVAHSCDILKFCLYNPYGLSYLIVLGLDILWVTLMKVYRQINIRVKAVLTVLVFTFSAAFLSWVWFVNSIGEIMH